MTLYDFDLAYLSGKKIDWSFFKGKKLLLVNVASKCGLTPQYAALQEIFDTFSEKQFMILGVPSNDFAEQEPGSPNEIQQFCEVNYGVTFPLSEKIHVTGNNIHPLYKWISETLNTEISWNFQKIALNENGELLRSYSPQTLPNDTELLNWIEA